MCFRGGSNPILYVNSSREVIKLKVVSRVCLKCYKMYKQMATIRTEQAIFAAQQPPSKYAINSDISGPGVRPCEAMGPRSFYSTSRDRWNSVSQPATRPTTPEVRYFPNNMFNSKVNFINQLFYYFHARCVVVIGVKPTSNEY